MAWTSSSEVAGIMTMAPACCGAEVWLAPLGQDAYLDG